MGIWYVYNQMVVWSNYASAVTTKPRKAPRRRLSAGERRERIFDGAMRLFAERGYHSTSMTDIAEAAGITPAVIYDHFRSKAELQIELLDRQSNELLAFVAAAVAGSSAEPAERMRAGVDAFFAFVEQHPYSWRIVFRDPPTDPGVAAAYRDLGERATQAIALFIRGAAPAELLAAPDADQRAEMFAQLLKTAQNGLAYWWYEHRDVPREVIVDRVIEFCWLGLERTAGGERA
jgi:AcrR family transcriptional regulator